jgi:methylenetetrahydrofolate dehydrogenase (NADP+) / methenyltetrahydrofolate cyclohydrolase
VQVLEGAPVAKKIRDDARREAARISPPPSLAVVLLGHDPASEAYVASKSRAAEEAGIRATTVRLPSGSTPEALLGAVRSAGADPTVDGVLVQMPLESGHDTSRIVDALDPYKDVDGLHPENVGLLHEGRPRFVPCTPAGILALLDHYGVTLEGARAVVVGRSSLVGRPLAALLMARNATVTVCHSKTRDLPAVCQEADVLVAAIGRPGLVTSEFVRPGATVVDVGINRVESEKGRGLVGDVDFDDVSRVAARISPVPGGVGPLTVAMLIHNTVRAARLRRGAEENRGDIRLQST